MDDETTTMRPVRVNGDFETPSLDGTPADYITSRYANWKYVIPTRGVF